MGPRCTAGSQLTLVLPQRRIVSLGGYPCLPKRRLTTAHGPTKGPGPKIGPGGPGPPRAPQGPPGPPEAGGRDSGHFRKKSFSGPGPESEVGARTLDFGPDFEGTVGDTRSVLVLGSTVRTRRVLGATVRDTHRVLGATVRATGRGRGGPASEKDLGRVLRAPQGGSPGRGAH